MQFDEIALDPNTGRLFDNLLKRHLVILDEDFYRGLHDRLYETFQSGAKVILYNIGLGYGEASGKTMTQMSGSRIEIFKIFMERGKHQGYGLFNVPLLRALISSFTGEVVVRLKNSFFALSAGNTGQVECQVVAGMIAGAAPLMFPGKNFRCIEEKCLSKGDDYCEFHLEEC